MCISLLTYLRFLCILDMFIYRISLIHVQNKKCQRWYNFYRFRKNLYQKNETKRRKRGNAGKRKIRWHYRWPESLQKPWHFLNRENKNQQQFITLVSELGDYWKWLTTEWRVSVNCSIWGLGEERHDSAFWWVKKSDTNG